LEIRHHSDSGCKNCHVLTSGQKSDARFGGYSALDFPLKRNFGALLQENKDHFADLSIFVHNLFWGIN